MTKSTRYLLAVLCALAGLLSPIPAERLASAAPVVGKYSSGPIGVPIPDDGVVEHPVGVNDAGTILDVNVRVRINHTWVSDLDLFVIGPDGTTVLLSTDNGDDGDNYGAGPTDCTGTFTTFDSQAGTSIVDGAPPFAGTFSPEQSLGAFNGKSPVGQWRLRVVDAVPDDVGTLFCWELEVTREPPAPPAAADLAITLTDAPDPIRSGTNVTYTLTIFNNGPAAAAATTATLNVPAGVTFVSATPSRGTCVPASTVNCNLGTVAAGATVTVTVIVTGPAVAAGTATLSATASVVSSVADPVPGNNSTAAQTTTVYSCAPRPNVVQTAAADGPGRVRVTITATSTAGAPANRLREIRFAPSPNARIEFENQVRTTPFTLPLPIRPEQVVFFVRRGDVPGAFTASFVVADDCGDRPSFAGGGTNVP